MDFIPVVNKFVGIPIPESNYYEDEQLQIPPSIDQFASPERDGRILRS